jgi:CRISPR type III-A-associated RAMP protein Csm4
LEFLNACKNNSPPVILSSAFPYFVNKDETHRFYPLPFLPLPSYKNVLNEIQSKTIEQKIKDFSQRKQKKDIAFIDENTFFDLVHGKIHWNSFTAKPSPKLSQHLLTHNTIHRLSGTSLMIDGTGQLFMEDEYYVSVPVNNYTEAGLFFLAYDNSGGLLERALRLLSVIGVGGNRSVGKGNFRFRHENFQIKNPEKTNALVNLSLYVPTPDELEFFKGNLPLFNYQLSLRGGYYAFPKNHSPVKPPRFFFKEGSFFPFMNKKIFGQNLIDQSFAETSLHRYGFGFMLHAYVNEQIIN